MTSVSQNIVSRVIEVLSTIKPEECRATVTAFTLVFILMASYFVLRPVRDVMASDWSDSEVSFLWNLQFFVSIAIVSLYGALVSRLQFKTVVPLVYAIFAASFVGFYFLTSIFAEPIVIEKSFYIWVVSMSMTTLNLLRSKNIKTTQPEDITCATLLLLLFLLFYFYSFIYLTNVCWWTKSKPRRLYANLLRWL